eukprot:g9075.t1
MGKISDWLANKNPAPDDDILSKGVVWNAKGEMMSCIFCDFAQGRKEQEILFEDELVAAFAPLKRAAKQHVLVIPKKHISTVGDLAPNDGAVLDRMRQVAEQLLKCDPANMQFSFHIPPWNSVDHLHLHAIETPFLSWWQGLRFSEGKPWCASFEKVKSAFCSSVKEEDKSKEETKVAGDEEQQV